MRLSTSLSKPSLRNITVLVGGMKRGTYMPSYELIMSVFVALLRLAAPSRSIFCSILKRREPKKRVFCVRWRLELAIFTRRWGGWGRGVASLPTIVCRCASMDKCLEFRLAPTDSPYQVQIILRIKKVDYSRLRRYTTKPARVRFFY